ncbi:MAG: hypothetical protein JRI43_08495 [Deltaproteobacteria bacterium]|nr:hypothetical protein [Deltaproteobacteria bacterium]
MGYHLRKGLGQPLMLLGGKGFFEIRDRDFIFEMDGELISINILPKPWFGKTSCRSSNTPNQ